MPERVLSDFRAWTARPIPPLGFVARDTVNLNTVRGHLWPDRGYKILRNVQSAPTTFNQPGGSWTHRHTDGTEYPFYYYDGALYKETGAGATSIASSITDKFAPAVAHMSSPNGASVFLNGTNAEARLLRVVGGALAAVLYDLDAPGNPAVGGTTAGSIADGTYYVLITWEDQDGATTVFSGPNATAQEVTLNGGGNGRITVDISGLTPPDRVTHWNIYVATTNSPDSFLLEADSTDIGTTSVDIDTLAQGEAIPSRNGIYRVAKMPLTGASMVVEHQGRLFVASTSSNLVYWTERNDPNHWYSTNGIAETEGGWNGPVRGLAATEDGVYVFTADAIHRIYGDFSRDPSTFAPRVANETPDTGIGCISPQSAVSIPGSGLFFMSQFGPAMITGGRVQLLAQSDFEPYRDFLDFAYADRWVGAFDPDLRCYLCAVTRKTNSTRPMDGAANEGICDRIVRWSLDGNAYCPPLALEVVHLSMRNHGTVGSSSNRPFLTAMGPHGAALRLNFGYAGGVSDGVVTDTDYDGKLATATTTESATVTLTGIADNALAGQTVTLFYPTDDDNFPGVVVQRTIKSNSTSGSSLTINWEGEITVPSGTEWTVRIAGLLRAADVIVSLDEDPSAFTRLDKATGTLWDVVGTEAA